MRLALAVASAGHQRQFRPDADEIGWQLRLQKKVQLQLPEKDHVKCSWCNCDCVPWTATRCASWLATDRSDVCHHECCDPDGACVYPAHCTNQVAQHVLPGRVLAIVVGSLRGSRESWRSLVELLLEPQQAALMLVVSQPLAELLASSSSAQLGRVADFNELLGRRVAHLVTVPEFDDWGSALDIIEQVAATEAASKTSGDAASGKSRRAASWRRRPVPCSIGHKQGNPLGGVRNVSCVARGGEREPLLSVGSAAIVGVYRWYAKRALVSAQLLPQFDWFVFTRTDVHLLCPLRLPSRPLLEQAAKGSEPFALVPEGEDWTGLADRFVIAGREAILPAITTIEHWVVGRAPLAVNPETQMLWSLKAACVRVMRIPRISFAAQHLAQMEEGETPSGGVAFERTRSNFGGCLHEASYRDIVAFRLPIGWAKQGRIAGAMLNTTRVPAEARRMGLCPKYRAEWALSLRTCSSPPAESCRCRSGKWDSGTSSTQHDVYWNRTCTRVHAPTGRARLGARSTATVQR